MAAQSDAEVGGPSRLYVAFQLGVIIPTLVGGTIILLREPQQLSAPSPLHLLAWVVIVAVVELLPVPVWRGLQVSMAFPLLIVVGFLYTPLAAAMVALVGSFDPREFRREVSPLHALFNRCQVALAVAAASGVFHALAEIGQSSTLELIGAAALAATADYVVNIALVSVFVSLRIRRRVTAVIRAMRIGSLPEFLVSYLALGLFGLVMSQFFLEMGFWTVPAFLIPLLFARQMFFRSRALEEAHRELQDREQVLRTLSTRMAEERQDERAAIAAYLHDDLAQLLFRLSIQVDVARRHLAAGKLDDAARVLDQIKDTKQQTSDRIRALIRDLHRSPLGPAGLAEAIHSFIAEAARDSEVRFHTDISEVPVPAPIALLLYHIAREGVMNTLKHADATNVWVTVKQAPEAVELVLRDDGRGFDPDAPPPEGHFGLAMMRERARVGGGTYEIQSAVGQGTTVTVRFPTALLREAERGEQAGRSSVGTGPAGEAGASPGTPRTTSHQEPSQQRVRA